MKITIGQKIKEIRMKKDMKQTAVHNNQSQISQIESGKISNPDEGTIKMIAKNLDVSFDELIENTDWSAPEKKAGQYAFSPTSFDFKIDDSGYITYKNKAFPKYDDNGDLNEFCPVSGEKLIGNCTKCGREIIDMDYNHCMGCGKEHTILWHISDEISSLVTPEVLANYSHCSSNLDEALTIKQDGSYWFNQLYKCSSYDDWISRKRRFFVGVDLLKPTIDPSKKFDEEKSLSIHFLNFSLGVVDAIEKKLRKTLTHLEDTEDKKSGSDTVYEKIYTTMENLIQENTVTIKTASTMTQIYDGESREIYSGYNEKLVESNEKYINMLADLLKSYNPDGDHSQIEQKLETIKSETQNSDEKISEDGNSETVAADTKAEPKKKDAKLNNKEVK